MSISPDKVKTILVLRNDRFGEFLLNIPAFRALKETFPSARLIAVIKPENRQLAEAIPYIDEIIEWENKKHSFAQIFTLIGSLRKRRIDIAVMLNPSKEFNIIACLSGIPVRLGYNRKLAFLLTHRLEDKKSLGVKHEIEYNLELVNVIGARTRDKRLSINLPEAELWQLGLSLRGDYVVIHPWTSDTIKNWPASNFKELAHRLAKDLGVGVVIIGGKDEARASALIFNEGSDVLADFTGKTDFSQLAGVLKNSRLLISCDSGPVHLAGCLDVPVLALFRDDLPGKTSTRWGPVTIGSRVIKTSYLSSVTVDEVFSAVRDMLKIKKKDN